MNIEKTEEVPEVTLDMLTEMQKSLRMLSIRWATLLIDQIKTDETIDTRFRDHMDVQKIRNIFQGVVRDREWRSFTYAQSKKLKETLSKKVTEIINS